MQINGLNGTNTQVGAMKITQATAGLSQASMKAIISADSAMAQARVQGSVATKMEVRAGASCRSESRE